MKGPFIPALMVLLVMAGFSFWFTDRSTARATLESELSSSKAKHLKAFSSESELKRFLKKLRKKRLGLGGGGGGTGFGSGNGAVADQVVTVSKGAAETVDVTATAQSESITNTQHAGVDEGGIVKMYGDYLVVLRRGRLFTVAIGDNSLKPVASINAYGPDIDPNETWYDEMLISENNVVVIGYSYDRGGTELGVFRIDGNGGLKYRATYHLRSNDYYSSRNYSSRLIGNKLIFYSPLQIDLSEKDAMDAFPALRKWHKGAKESEFRRIVDARNVYRVENGVDYENESEALHTVTTCDLANAEMSCTATSVIGPEGDVFYVSPKSVYVWASNWDSENEKEHNRSILFKMPLDGTEPSALRVSGSPIDQFSFLEDENDGLNVLVSSDSNGDGMWRAEVTEGETALLRIPETMFSDGSATAPASSYRPLERTGGYGMQNRFIGDYLLYGSGNSWDAPREKSENKLYVVNWKTGEVSTVALAHSVDRLDALSSDGIVVGTNGKRLLFTSVRLDNMPRLVDTYVVDDASQGETRSQGFFYKPENANGGMLGLPIAENGRPGYEQLRQGSASIIFLRNDSLRFSEIGRLKSESAATQNDDCKASCVDWYGNARPIFTHGRIFALLGYEIVEGALRSNRIEEIKRVNFAPSTVASKAK